MVPIDPNSVMHMSSIILKEPANDKYLSDLEKLGIIVGALCHDVGHTGFTNTF